MSIRKLRMDINWFLIWKRAIFREIKEINALLVRRTSVRRTSKAVD